MCILTPVREVEGLPAAREGVRRKAEVEGGRVRLAEGDGAGTSGLRLLTVSWPPPAPGDVSAEPRGRGERWDTVL